jgi:hypothetical protein
VRYLQGAAGAVFTLTVASLILFWTVKDTKPSGDAVLPILYAAAGASAVIWLGAELWKHWSRNRKRASETPRARASERASENPPQAGSIAAGQAIRAGGNISATTSIKAGHDIQAGGSIHSGTPPIKHGPIRWDQIGRLPQAGEEEIPLEPWLEDRIAAHVEIVRQRKVRGGKWFFEALGQWDVRNTHELLTKVAPDLVDSYRGNLPGFRAGADVRERESYYERQLMWLTATLRKLREGDAGPPSDLAAWLAQRASNMRRYAQRLREQIDPGVAFDWQRCVSIVESFERENQQVIDRLHLDAPEWSGYYMQNPPWFKGAGVTPVQTRDFEERARLMDFGVGQLRQISEGLAGVAARTSDGPGGSLSAWLDLRATELRSLKARLDEILAAPSFELEKARAVEHHVLRINDEVDRKLHIVVPEWVDYFNENQSNLPLTLTFLDAEHYRQYLDPAIDATIKQIVHIGGQVG